MDAFEFKRRFLPLNRRLYRVAWSLTHNVQDAEDLVQETYCRLWRKRNDLSSIGNDEAYCVRLLKNFYYDGRRMASSHDVDIGPPDNLPLPATDDVQRDIERDERAQVLHRIIDTLPDRQRDIITRRDLLDEPFADIAADLQMPEGSVRTLLSRARLKLKEQFLNWMNNDNPRDQHPAEKL